MIRDQLLRIVIDALHHEKHKDDEYDLFLRLAWDLLSKGEQATLRAIVLEGPTWDGDVLSKSCRDTLLDLELIFKVINKNESGYQAAGYIGGAIYKENDTRK